MSKLDKMYENHYRSIRPKAIMKAKPYSRCINYRIVWRGDLSPVISNDVDGIVKRWGKENFFQEYYHTTKGYRRKAL